MKVTRVLHSSVNAAGRLDDTRRFYAERLGLPPAPRPEIPGVPGCWFEIGDVQVHVIGAPAAGHGIDPTGDHCCFGVEDIEAAVAELEAARIPYVRAAQGPRGGVVQIWITDPAGNTVELQEDGGNARPPLDA